MIAILLFSNNYTRRLSILNGYVYEYDTSYYALRSLVYIGLYVPTWLHVRLKIDRYPPYIHP